MTAWFGTFHGTFHYISWRENKSSSSHKREIWKIIELEGTLRCQLIYPLPTARSALPKPVLTALAALRRRRTGSLLGEEVPWRSLSWWLSDYVWWELRNLHSLHSFPSVEAVEFFLFVFLPFLCSPLGYYGLFGAWLLKGTGCMTLQYVYMLP